VAFSLFGYLLLDSWLAGTEAIVSTDMVALFIFDHHIAWTPALAIEQLMPSQAHQYAFGNIMIGIVDPPKLFIDFIGKFFGLLKLSQEIVGTHIDLLHYLPFFLN